MATVLGLNAYHGDSAVCLIVDGKLVAAAEEERFAGSNIERDELPRPIQAGQSHFALAN